MLELAPLDPEAGWYGWRVCAKLLLLLDFREMACCVFGAVT